MAKFTSTAPLNLRWFGNEISGAAGATHRIPDALYDEFNATYSGAIPGLTWIAQDETTALSPATVVTAALTATSARFKGEPWFDVKAYGATGDGATDDTAAIQSAVAAASAAGGGTVAIPRGSYLISTVSITTPHVSIVGFGGILVDGTVSIGVASQTQPYTYYDATIQNVRFIRSATSSSVNAIEMRRAYRVRVTGCYFEKYNAAIFTDALSTSAPHVGQLIVDGCSGTKDNISGTERRCRYLLYVSANTAGTTFAGADIQVVNNNVDSLISNVHAGSIDGLVVSSNTFFLGGSSESSTIKESNVRVLKGSQVVISANQMFEAGYEAILLNGCQNFAVSGNNIVQPGQRDLRSGIAITGGDFNGAAFCLGSITGNAIMFPSRHGISVEGVSGDIAIVGNEVRAAGDGTGYYGATAIGSVAHAAINVESTASNVLVIGNMGAGNSNSLLGTGYYDGNWDQSSRVQRKVHSSTITSTSATVSALALDRVIFSMATTATVTSISNPFDGQDLLLYGSNGNTTIAHSADIRLKSSTNATIPTNATLTLRHIGGVGWVEIGRSF